jgi:hypothetical protein
MSANHPVRNLARCLAHFRIISRQLPGSRNRNAAECPHGNLQDNSQYGAQRPRRNPRNKRCNIPQNISQDDSSESRHHAFNHPVLKL